MDATALHRPIRHVYAPKGREMRSTSPATLRRHLAGHSLEGTRRHGKQLFAEIAGDDRWLRLHFGMTGFLEAWSGEEPDGLDHVRLRLDFEGGDHLAYVCQRRFGEIGLVADPDAFARDAGMGPDLLSDELTEDRFLDLLGGRRGTVKGALMNQSIVAGLGNVYTDETLFQVGVHPETRVSDLDDEAVIELLRVSRRVVRRAVEGRADPDRMPRTWLLPRREEGRDCPRCSGTIEKIEVSGRTTYFCPRHQPRPS